MSELTIFSFQDDTSNTAVDVRTIMDQQGEPWFVAKDVAVALGYANTRQAVTDHCDDAKSLKDMGVAFHDPLNNQALSSLDPQTKLIPESDVYGLVFGSKLPSAERFKRWLKTEVLPAIRKTGSYSVQRPWQPQSMPSPAMTALQCVPPAVEAAKAFGFDGNQASLYANRFVLRETGVDVLAGMGAKALPAADNMLLLSPSEIALKLGLGRNQANPLLIACGLQTAHRDFKSRLYYELTEEGRRYGVVTDTDKTHSNGAPIQHIKWKESVLEVLREHLEAEAAAEV